MTNRRSFVVAGAAGAAVAARTGFAHQDSPQRTVRLGVMGLSRGSQLAMGFAALEDVRVEYVCDVDTPRLQSFARQFKEITGKDVKAVGDFRNILDDPQIDALVIAAPNHWHAPATIMACKAGKHVYVEKPCSHNPLEGEWMIAAARQFDRRVQVGTQRRSAAGTQEAMRRLHDGQIGQVHLARCYYHALRGPTGIRRPADPPAELDYELWEGPAPHRPYCDNVVPYKWHWYWHWGGGELANNGVHGLDLCRWGLDVDYPVRTVSSGGRYWYDDDQETPDTQSASFEFDSNKQITWDALSCNKHGPGFICMFYGNQGALELDSDGIFRVYDRGNELVDEGSQRSVGQTEHLQNFVDAIRTEDDSLLNQPITEGHKSTLLCHLGNIAYRSGRTVVTKAETGHILGDKDQQKLWRREYSPAWEDAVSMS